MTAHEPAGSPQGLRALLAELGVRPYKGWGQNFLTDPRVPERMVAAAHVEAGDMVVEIGPGLGVLTAPLLATGAAVLAVEIDPRLASYLVRRFAGAPRLRLIVGDILTLAPDDLVPAGVPYKLVANLPYSVTSAVLRHVLTPEQRPAVVAVMVQREVAERIAAVPPDMSLLAVSVQFFGRPRIAFRVPPGAFHPAPEVESAVVVVETGAPPLPQAEHAAFFRIVAAGFSQRRKTLLNSLGAGLRQPRESVMAALAAAGLNPRQRAETLAVDDWVRLYTALRDAGLEIA